MTPRDIPGPIVIESLFPWLAALEPAAQLAPHPLRATPSGHADRDGRPVTQAA
jgi:hypothetical protein